MRQVLVLVLKYNWLTRTVKLKDEFPHGFSHITVSFHSVKLCSTRIVKQVFYRPQRSCGQCNIFTPVCHSFCSRGGGGGLPQCMLGYHPPREQTPPEQTNNPPGEADSSIRSTSGRYASYWNAFLFKNQNSYFCCEVLQWFTILSVREVA